MTDNELKIDFFGDGMRIFVDYIARQYKKNPDYQPHPIIKAFDFAVQGIQDKKVGERVMGFSKDGTETNIYEPYVVIIEKKENNFIEVKEIRNLSVDKTLPVDVMVILFRLQIQLDKANNSNTVSPQEAVDALNAIVPGEKFYALGDRWMEARDIFRQQLQEGLISIPDDPELIKGLTSIKYDTPWEDYPNNLRSLIGSSIAPSLNKEGAVIITSPKNAKIEKYKIFDTLTRFLIGDQAKYLKLFENQ